MGFFVYLSLRVSAHVSKKWRALVLKEIVNQRQKVIKKKPIDTSIIDRFRSFVKIPPKQLRWLKLKHVTL